MGVWGFEFVGKSDTLLGDLDQFVVKISLKWIENYEFPAISDDPNFRISWKSMPPNPLGIYFLETGPAKGSSCLVNCSFYL